MSWGSLWVGFLIGDSFTIGWSLTYNWSDNLKLSVGIDVKVKELVGWSYFLSILCVRSVIGLGLYEVGRESPIWEKYLLISKLA